jgi:hypothetical protein
MALLVLGKDVAERFAGFGGRLEFRSALVRHEKSYSSIVKVTSRITP